MLNFKTRRLAKLPDEAQKDYKKLMPDPPKHSIPKDQTRLKLPEVSDNLACILHRPSVVYTDMNNHVNNTAYLTWIVDSIPNEVLQNYIIAQYEVDYKAEAVLGAPSSTAILRVQKRLLFFADLGNLLPSHASPSCMAAICRSTPVKWQHLFVAQSKR